MAGDLLAGAGVVLAAAAAAAAMLLPASRARSAAMICGLALAPALVLGDQWNSTRVADLRHDPERLAALALAAAAAVAALLVAFRRRPLLLPLAALAALPFRIPLHAGGDQANLLIPLYLVIAAGVAAATLRDWRLHLASMPAGGADLGDRSEARLAPRGGGTKSVTGPAGPVTWLTRLLAAFVFVYALQVLYSEDFSQGLQNVCFFFVPFSLAFALLRDARWGARLLVAAIAVLAVEGVVFSLVGFVEFGTRELLWNDAVIRSNEFHVYFRVNSLFWDPNVYGRYLVVVIVILVAALLWVGRGGFALLLAGTAGLQWLGLLTTYSQSSFAALIAGLAALAALRWSLKWTAIACSLAAIVGLAVVLASGFDLSTENEVNKDTGGRADLVSGGAELFGDRPIWGYGAGSFSRAFRKHVAGRRPPVSESHTEPVTVGAEQGLIGLAAYVALLVAAFLVLCTGLRDIMPGLGRAPPAATGPAGQAVARAAILAAFIALLVHTMAYAGFFEDPFTWVLLAVGASLAGAARDRGEEAIGTGPAASDQVRAPA